MSAPANGLRFSHVALNCADPRASERFYSKHFGFRRARVIPLGGEQQIVFLRCGEVLLELFPSDGATRPPAAEGDGPHASGVRHLAFQVDSVDDALAAMGDEAQLTLGPLDFSDVIPGWRTVWLRDPDGNIVEVSQGYVDQEPARQGEAPSELAGAAAKGG